jgi:hypothetical protein
MNNSFDRLLVGLIETLRCEVLPKLEGEFVRGQTFGVIYMLNFLRLRASWSLGYLGPQIDALDELAVALAAIPGLPEAVQRPVIAPRAADATGLQAARDAGDAQVAALIDWLGTAGLDEATERATDLAIKAYIRRQLRHELNTSARPMFAEISLGEEQTTPGVEPPC